MSPKTYLRKTEELVLKQRIEDGCRYVPFSRNSRIYCDRDNVLIVDSKESDCHLLVWEKLDKGEKGNYNVAVSVYDAKRASLVKSFSFESKNLHHAESLASRVMARVRDSANTGEEISKIVEELCKGEYPGNVNCSIFDEYGKVMSSEYGSDRERQMDFDLM